MNAISELSTVEAPVDERGAHVDERVPGEHAGLHRLLDALVDRGMYSAGSSRPTILLTNSAAALAGGLEVEVDVAELTAAAALADEPALDLGDGLAIKSRGTRPAACRRWRRR